MDDELELDTVMGMDDELDTVIPSRLPTEAELAGVPVIPRYPSPPNTDWMPTWIPPQSE